jgi:putative thioredoxin
MKKEVYIFEAGSSSFDETALHNSHSLPVIVEFMGFWSEPCIILSELWASLANEFASRFIFVKVDIDEHPELRKQYQITNVPTTKVFINAEAVITEEGQLTEDECRAMLKVQGIFHESDEMRLEARELYLSGDVQAAFMKLTEAIKQDPQNTRIALDMVQIFIDIKMLDNANDLFNKLPEKVKSGRMGLALQRQLALANHAIKTDGIDVLQARIAANANDHDARFDYAVCLFTEHRTLEGIDQLFNILETDREYRGGAARELVSATIASLKDNEPETAKQIQQRLNNLLN